VGNSVGANGTRPTIGESLTAEGNKRKVE
jgi:hypothetical protein